MPLLRGPDGAIIDVADDQVGHFTIGGYTPVTEGEAGAVTGAMARPDSGALGGLGAFASSSLSGATLGLSDLALKGFLDRGDFERMATDRENHPVLSGVGQVAGSIAPMLAAPGSSIGNLPAGRVSHTAADAVAGARALGGAPGTLLSFGVSGLEGSLYNAGAYLSDTALGDRDLSAEGLAGALGSGFEFGVAGGVAALGIEQGSIAARRMFSRLQDGTSKAVAQAEQDWVAKYQATIEANDAAAEVARAKLAEARLATQQANVYRRNAAAGVASAKAAAPAMDAQAAALARDADVASMGDVERAAGMVADAGHPAMPQDVRSEIAQRLQELARRNETVATGLAGMPHPEGVGLPARALTPSAEADLTAALAEHDAARADLDAMLARIEAPGVQTPGAVGAPGPAVPVAEFGAPGARGYNPGAVPEPRPPTVVEAKTGDVTAVGKKRFAEATPVGERTTAFDFKDSGLTFDPETRNYATKEVAPSAAPLSEAEFKAMKQSYGHAADQHFAAEMYYSKGGDELLNPELRSGKQLSAEAKKLNDSLMEAYRLPEARLPRDAEVYRGLSDKFGDTIRNRFADIKPGDVLDDPAFMSTSYYAGGGSRGEQVVFLIHAPAGSPALPIRSKFGGEGELLFPPHSKLRVDSVGMVPVGERWHLKMGGGKEGFAREHGGMEILPDGTTVLGSGESATRHPPLKEIRATLIEAPAPEVAAPRPPPVDHNAPLDELSMRQLGEYQESLTKAFDGLSERSPEYKALSAKWDAAAERRMGISEGKIHPPEHEYGAKASVAAPTDSLTGLLRGTSEGLTVGKSLGELGAPSVAEYRAAKAAKTAQAAEHFRDRALGRAYSGSAMGAAEREAQAAALGIAPTAQHPHAVQQLEVAHEAAVERAAAAVEPAERAAAEREVAAIEQHMSRVGARPGAVEDIAAVAEVATKYERASAKLAEALGQDAPPIAQESAKAVRAAEESAERKTMDRTTRAIDDHAEQPARKKGNWKEGVVTQRAMRGGERAMTVEEWRARYPARAAGDPDAVAGATGAAPFSTATPATKPGQAYIDAAQKGKLSADAGYAQARAAEAEAKLAADRASHTAGSFRAGAEAARPASLGASTPKPGLATAAAVGAELFDIPGIPKPHDIPVIGPLLGVYLKYRAIKAAAGRFVGRVPATADSRAAALVARTKDRIATAVDRTLGLGAKPAARTMVVASAAVLGRRVFDDGEPDAPKGASPQAQAAVRIREIAAAAARPELVIQQVRAQMRGVADPDLIEAAEKHMVARFQYLASVMPKLPPPNPFSKTEWQPSPAAADDLAQRLTVANDPEAAFKLTTPATVHALGGMYPKLLELAKQRLMERVSDTTHPMTYNDQLRASLLFGMPVSPSMVPESVAILQNAHARMRPTPAPQSISPPTPSIASGVGMSQLYDPANQRRAARM